MGKSSRSAFWAIALTVAAAALVLACHWAGGWAQLGGHRRALLLANAAALAAAAAVLAHHLAAATAAAGAEAAAAAENFEELALTVGPYNEDLARISRDLQAYYSCFSANSYAGSGSMWTNLSRALQASSTSCGISDYDSSHMRWENPPSFAPRDGFMLGANSATGPESHRAGISTLGAFSVFAFVRFTGLAASSTSDYEVFNVFANTPNNNGLRLFIQGSTVQPRTGGAKVVFKVEYGGSLTGADTVFTCAVENRSDVDVDFESNYLLVVVKEYNALRVHMYRAPGSGRVDMLSRPLGSTAFKFSNQEIVLNRGKNLNARVMAFGIYSRALGDSELHELQGHLYEQLARLEPRNQETQVQILQLQQQVQTLQTQLTACPFDAATCGACSMVRDWSSWGGVLAAADSVCLDAVNRFCTDNPGHPQCSCWNSNSAAYHTNACRNYRGVFTDGRCYALDALDDKAVATVKQRYNLCGCQEETPRRGGALGSLPPLDKFLIPLPGSAGTGGSCGTAAGAAAGAAAAAAAGAMPVSGFNGATDGDVVNYFNTARDPKVNAAALLAANALAAAKPVRRTIADPFANDPVTGKARDPLPEGQSDVKSWWSSFFGSGGSSSS